MHRIAWFAATALLAAMLTACGALVRSGQTPLPGPTVSPTGTFGTGIPAEPDQGGLDAGPTTTEEPDFPG